MLNFLQMTFYTIARCQWSAIGLGGIVTMRSSSAAALLVIAALLGLGAPSSLAQPGGPPEWVEKTDPTKYILLAANFKPPFAYGTDPLIEAQGQGTRLDDGQGHVTEQTVVFMYAMQTVKLAQPYANTAATKPPTAMRWDMDWTMTVGIYQNEEVAKAAVRAHYLSDFGPLTAEDENCLNDARLRNGRGAAGAMGRFVRCRNLLLRIDAGNVREVKSNRAKMDSDLWNGADGNAMSHQQDLIAALARLWLDKVAGPDRADLHVQTDKVLLRWWSASPNVEREPAADQQYVVAQVDNRSDKVVAVGVEARLLLAQPGEAEMQPIGRPVHLPDIAPGSSRLATFYWDLGGKSIENALLRVEVAIPNIEDADIADNQCDLKCSIYLAHNGSTPYRWVDDSYSFGNYGFDDREGQEMLEGILATVIGQVYTDPQASALLTRLIFPQTYSRFMSYLSSSMKEGAGGHCYGLAATAGLYFLDASLRPGGGRTSDMTRDAASANINIYQRAQMVPMVQALLSGEEYFARNWGGLNCLNAVRNIIKTQRKPVILSISGTKQVQQQVIVNGQPQMQQVQQRWGHALLAYKVVEVEGRTSAVYVYDPNLAPRGEWATQNPSSAFGINPTTGAWAMTPNMTALYGGVDSIAAREVTRAVSLTEANAVIPALKAKLAEMMAWFDKVGKLMVALHCPVDALCTDPEGRRVGMLNGQRINEVPGAEIRSSGEVEIYVLPRDVQFSVQLTGTDAGQAGLDVIRSKGGVPEIVVFDKLPVANGSRLQATLAKGGTLERITSEDGKRIYTPALIGTLQGDRVSWQGGTQQPSDQPTDQPTTVGELVVCRSVSEGQPVGVADTFPRLPTVACLLRHQNLTPQTATCVWTRGGTEVSRSQRVLQGGNGWISFSLRTDDPAGLTAGRWEITITGTDATVLGRRTFTMGQVAGSTPTDQANRGAAITLTGGTSSTPGPTSYPTASGALRTRISYTAPGTVLDTVGINAATPGDFALGIDAQGRVSWQIYNPAVTGAHRNTNGWHILTVDRKLKPGQWYAVEAAWGVGGVSLKVGKEWEVHDPAKLKLSGRPIFIGDFPGDESWGAGYNTHQSFTGEVAGLTIE
jgi:hypothetical protein